MQELNWYKPLELIGNNANYYAIVDKFLRCGVSYVTLRSLANGTERTLCYEKDGTKCPRVADYFPNIANRTRRITIKVTEEKTTIYEWSGPVDDAPEIYGCFY